MPKYRQLYVKLLDSYDYNEMPDDFTRVVWIHLILILDSEGRGIYNMTWIRNKMFPIRQDIKLPKLQAAFDWIIKREMVKVYTVNGREYFYVPNFQEYQSGTRKEAPSILPAPPEQLRSNSGAIPEEVRAAASASTSELESESELIKEAKPIKAAPGKTPYIRIFSEVTGMVGIPGNSGEVFEALDNLMAANGTEEATIEYLKPYFEAWKKLKTKNGQPYSKTNLAWLTEHAIAGQLPGNGTEPPKARKVYE